MYVADQSYELLLTVICKCQHDTTLLNCGPSLTDIACGNMRRKTKSAILVQPALTSYTLAVLPLPAFPSSLRIPSFISPLLPSLFPPSLPPTFLPPCLQIVKEHYHEVIASVCGSLYLSLW